MNLRMNKKYRRNNGWGRKVTCQTDNLILQKLIQHRKLHHFSQTAKLYSTYHTKEFSYIYKESDQLRDIYRNTKVKM